MFFFYFLSAGALLLILFQIYWLVYLIRVSVKQDSLYLFYASGPDEKHVWAWVIFIRFNINLISIQK